MSALQPRPHQVAALTDLTTALAVHDRTQLVMACGTGKTLVGRWHAQASDAEQILVLLPSLALVAQTLREWRRATGRHDVGWVFDALIVCSDPTTAAGAAERELDEDGLTVPRGADWSEQRARVTTDPAAAAAFLRRHQPGRHTVVFSTYHSSPVIAAAQRAAGGEHRFDLVIADEAHRLAGRPSDAFGRVLDGRGIVARKRLFMTATPKAFAGDGHSMDDHALFGPVAHTVRFGDAIAAGLLTDYQVLVVTGREAPGTPGETVPAVLAKAIDEHHLTRILTFHGRVAKAEAFAAAIAGHSTTGGRRINAQHVSGKQRAGDRLNSLSWLGGDLAPDEVRVVSNARCLSEGVDVPAVDGILFADQRSSMVDVLQAVGRVLRPSPGKRLGTIVLPMTLPADGDDDTALLLDDAFSNVWTVLRSLRAHDQRLAAEIDDLTRESARRSHTGHLGGFRLPRIHFVFPDGFELPELELRAVRELGSTWERNLGLLQAWVEHHNGKLVPRMAKALDGTVNLGEWCEQQRIAHRRGLLDADRTRRLEEVTGWAWDKADARWRQTHALLASYAAERGTVADHHAGESRFEGMYDCDRPRRHLRVWMAVQRQAYRLGTLAADYTALLESLPGWTWDGGLPTVDVEHVEALRQFADFEKHARVPAGHIEDGLRLDAWCWAVRRRKLTGHLSPVLEAEILAATPSQDRPDVRFPWETYETQWRLGYFALRQYAEREGTATVGAKHREQLPDTEVRVGQWAALQRFKHRRGDLEPRFVELLETVPGWQWEIDLKTVQAEEPVDLTGFATDHGRPGAYSRPHYCKCTVCLAAKRESQNRAAARKTPRLADPVPTGDLREHVAALEAEIARRTDGGSGTTRNGRMLIAAVSEIPLGTLRKLANGTLEQIERAHADRLRQVTVEQVLEVNSVEGSRGRMISTLTAKVDSGPTLALFDDLAARGFGATWVGRELGYHGAPQIGTDTVQLRVAKAVANLHARVGDLVMPPLPRNAKKPSLAELLAERAAERKAS